jgi:nicotinate-nucleotide adenylyltransferase
MRLGILGGTFDPIHNGHLIVAEEMRERFALDTVYLIPAKVPPHKTTIHITSGQHRLNMVNLAIQGNPNIQVSDIELHREGYSFSIDTIDYFSKKGQVFLIMGHDSFQAIETWFRYKDFFRISRIIVALRPGSPPINWTDYSIFIQAFYPAQVWDLTKPPDQHIDQENSWRVCLLPIPGLLISATEIRNRVQQMKTIRYLVPESVRTYIQENRLYIRSSEDREK